ncbi:MAG: hypothetical protein B7Y80_00515 [Hyphomicrobium sp. 32-62-53]|nr:MAG: hypothetical protein B7Z29_13835 [Hyphomicrobium sp. 12-62-95]OYY01836.1 MAG: hypothetical protein B7Y80_00515 [Hyphomicrobium sp. 32-62-53]
MQPDNKKPSAILDLLSFLRPFLGFVCVPLILGQTTEGLTFVAAVLALALLIHFFTTSSTQRHGTGDDFRLILDSACESIFHFTIYIALMLMGWFPIWALFVCYAGDLLVPYLCVLARQRGANVVYRPSLTLRTATHALVQAALILPHIAGPALAPEASLSVSFWLACLAIAVTIGTVIDYSLAILSPRTKS